MTMIMAIVTDKNLFNQYLNQKEKELFDLYQETSRVKSKEFAYLRFLEKTYSEWQQCRKALNEVNLYRAYPFTF